MARRITVEIVADPRRYAQGLREAEASTSNFVRGLERTSRGALAGTVAITGMGRAIAFASAQFLGGYGLLYALSSTVKSAVQFQQAMTLIQTQAGGTAQEVQKMTKSVLSLAPSVGTSPDQLAKGLYHIESSGIRGAKAMETLKIAAQGAKLGNADLEAVVNGLVGAEISGIKGTKDLAATMGSLDAIVGSGNLRMEDLAHALSSGVIPVARVFGLSLNDVGAALSTLTVHGIPAVMAANRLRTAFTFLAAGTPAAEKALSAIQLTTHKVGDTMRKEGLVPALQLISDHLKRSGLDATEQAQVISRAFGGARGGSTVIILLKYLDQVQKHLDQINLASHTFGQKWEAETKTAKFATDKLKASVSTLGDFIGLALLPTVFRVSNSMSKWLSNTQNQERIQTDLTKAVKDTRAVLTPFYYVLEGISKVVGGWSHLLEGVVAIKLARVFIGWSNAARTAMTSLYMLAAAEKAVAVAGGSAALGSGAAAAGAFAATGAASRVESLGVTALMTKQAQREAAIARAGQSGMFVHGGTPSANPLLFVPPTVTPVRAGMSTGGVDVMATKEASASMAKLALTEESVGLAGMIAAGKVAALNLGMRALSLVNPILITVTILYVLKGPIKSLFEGLPGSKGGKPGSWDPANIAGHIPGVSWLQNHSQGIGNILSFGAFGDNEKRWRADAVKAAHVQFIKNMAQQDRLNPRIDVPGSGVERRTIGVDLHTSFFTPDKATQLQLQLDKARVQVAMGNTAANQLVVSILRKQIAMDEVAFKAQEKLLKKGIGSAQKHTQTMSALLKDEASMFNEIASINKKQTDTKTWELPVGLQVAQAWAANADSASGGTSATVSVSRQIVSIVNAQIKSGKLKGDNLVAAINVLTQAQDAIAAFNIPVKLALAQAWAATTTTLNDDISVAIKLRDLIMSEIKSGKLKGKALKNAVDQLPGLLSVIRNNFNIPIKLQLAAAKAATTTVTTDDRAAAQAYKDFAEAYLKSKRRTAEGMLAAYNAISGANQTLNSGGVQTAYTMASTHHLTAGLGLTRAQRIAQEQRIAQMEAHGGRTPKQGWLGVMGFAVNGNAAANATRGIGNPAMTVHTPTVTIHAAKVTGSSGGSVVININGGNPKDVEKAVLKALQKTRRYSAPQRRGQNGGHTLGLD